MLAIAVIGQSLDDLTPPPLPRKRVGPEWERWREKHLALWREQVAAALAFLLGDPAKGLEYWCDVAEIRVSMAQDEARARAAKLKGVLSEQGTPDHRAAQKGARRA